MDQHGHNIYNFITGETTPVKTEPEQAQPPKKSPSETLKGIDGTKQPNVDKDKENFKYPLQGAPRGAEGGYLDTNRFMKPGYAEGGKVEKVMHEFKHGQLHSGSKKGPMVTNRDQAVAIAMSEQRKAARGGYQEGGEVTGPGGPTEDQVPANLSNGEYVIPADVVAYLGTATLDNLVKQAQMKLAMKQAPGPFDDMAKNDMGEMEPK